MDQTQTVVIQALMMTGATLTSIGSSQMLRSLWKNNPWFKNARVDQKILGTMASVSFIHSMVQFQNRFFVEMRGICTVLAFLNQWLGISEMMLNMFLSMNFLLILIRNGKKVDQNIFYGYLSIALGIPLVGAIVGLSLNAYGDAVTSCWIIKSRFDLRTILYIVPLWTSLLFSILFNAIAVYKVYIFESKLYRNGYNRPVHLTRVASKSFVYCEMFILAWIFPTISRFYEAAYGMPPFWLLAIHSFCMPSAGFFTSIGYFMLQYLKQNEVIRRRPSGFMSSVRPLTMSSDTGQEQSALSNDVLIPTESSFGGSTQ